MCEGDGIMKLCVTITLCILLCSWAIQQSSAVEAASSFLRINADARGTASASVKLGDLYGDLLASLGLEEEKK